jgi:hypothetical protein
LKKIPPFILKQKGGISIMKALLLKRHFRFCRAKNAWLRALAQSAQLVFPGQISGIRRKASPAHCIRHAFLGSPIRIADKISCET